jgi:aquaporin Z
MEALGLGLFMVAAGLFGILIEYPGSPVRAALPPDPLLRRLLMGLAMGLTAVGLIHSPWGRRSGAHLNPAVTLAFLRLKKTTPPDALFYSLFQSLGGTAGLFLVSLLLGGPLMDPSVRYVATVPGPHGASWAFAAEALISFALMLAVLATSNHARLARWTPFVAGALVATWITVEAPVSGMSMNPARSFASALNARLWTSFWVYLLAPPLGMLAAAEVFRRARGAVRCAKLHHRNPYRCIFRCSYPH